MKKLLKKVIKPFLPTYEVVCTNYHVIPGHPINGNHSKHKFEKGASEAARKFYVQVVNSELTKTMAPMEVQLKKGGRTIEKSEFGPVNDLKKFKINYNG